MKTGENRRQIGVGGFEISERAKELVREVLDSNRITYFRPAPGDSLD